MTIEITKENYNPKQNYYFVDYQLLEKGDPDYVAIMKKDDPSYPNGGFPRWIREPFQTEQDVQETLNFSFHPYPHKIQELRIRSEEELNEVITIDEKTNERIWKHDDEDAFDKGLKLTQRENDFGSNYQFMYDHTTGVIDENGMPYSKEIPEGLNTNSRMKMKESEGEK